MQRNVTESKISEVKKKIAASFEANVIKILQDEWLRLDTKSKYYDEQITFYKSTYEDRFDLADNHIYSEEVTYENIKPRDASYAHSLRERADILDESIKNIRKHLANFLASDTVTSLQIYSRIHDEIVALIKIQQAKYHDHIDLTSDYDGTSICEQLIKKGLNAILSVGSGAIFFAPNYKFLCEEGKTVASVKHAMNNLETSIILAK